MSVIGQTVVRLPSVCPLVVHESKKVREVISLTLTLAAITLVGEECALLPVELTCFSATRTKMCQEVWM